MAQELYLLRNGNNILTNPVTPITDFTVSLNHMGDNKITATFYYPQVIEFQFNEYVIYEHEGEYEEGDPDATETFYLIMPPTREKNEKSLMVKYDCEFVSKQEILKYVPMIDSFQILGSGIAPIKPSLYQTEYSFFGGAKDYFNNIVSSMISEFGSEEVAGIIQPKGWVFEIDLDNGYPQVGEDISITVSNNNVFDALRDIFEKFKVPFFIKNNHVVVGGQKRYVSHIFRYGKGNGLYKLTKSRLNDEIITKIRGVGSERNIPYNYLQKEKKDAGLAEAPMSRLMPFIYRETLASAASNPAYISAVQDYYVSDNYNKDFPRISFETFDDIYPTIKGATYDALESRTDKRIDKIIGVYFDASSVSDENSTIVKNDSEEVVYPRFWIKIPPLGFDLKNHLNEKDKLVLSPTTGLCGGCKFNVLSIGSREGIWEGFRSDTYQQYDKFLLENIELDAFANIGVSNYVNKNTAKYNLPNGTILHYNVRFDFSSNILISGSATQTASVSIYKNGILYETIMSETQTQSVAGTFSDTFEDINDLVLSCNEQDEIEIRVSAQCVVTGGRGSYSKVRIPIITVDIEYPVSGDVAGDTTDKSQWLLVQKDIDSYNTLMPYPIEPMWTRYDSPEQWVASGVGHVNPSGIVPVIDDEYVFLGITLPDKYIIDAEKRLESSMIEVLNNNKEYKYNYDCGFDEKMLLENPSINSDVKIGSVILVYDGINPDEQISEDDCEEVIINSLTLKYSAEKTVATTNS